MQVFHEHALIALKYMKTGKLQESHSMAMVCKTVFESVNAKTGKQTTTWSKIKFHNANVKYPKTTTLYYKNDTVVRSKHLKLNVPYEKQLTTSPTAVCENNKRPPNASNKMRPQEMRSAKR
jgi:hypothetical protein